MQKLRASAVLLFLDDFFYSWPLLQRNAKPIWRNFSACAIISKCRLLMKRQWRRGPHLNSRVLLLTLFLKRLDYLLVSVKNFAGCFINFTNVEQLPFGGFSPFACSVVVPGRTFLRRLIDLTKGIKKAHHHIRLNKDARHVKQF